MDHVKEALRFLGDARPDAMLTSDQVRAAQVHATLAVVDALHALREEQAYATGAAAAAMVEGGR